MIGLRGLGQQRVSRTPAPEDNLHQNCGLPRSDPRPRGGTVIRSLVRREAGTGGASLRTKEGKDPKMRKTYQILAWIIVGGVVVQAASIALGFGGMASYVNSGGVVDKAIVESRSVGNFSGEIGFPIHALVGGVVIPLATLMLVAVSFFARVQRGRTLALVVLGLVFVQTMAGYSIKDMPYLGLLHGANALALLLTALFAARRARTPVETAATVPSAQHVPA